MARVALYIGGSLPPNLVRLLTGFGRVVDDAHELVIVGSGVDPEPLPARYEYADVPDDDAARGVTRMVATYRRIDSYLRRTDAPPEALWQITAPQFHAIPAILAGRRHGVPVATRLPGNKFDEYRFEGSNLDRAKAFLLNNVGLRALRFSKLVATLSEYNRRQVCARGIAPERVRLLRPPLDTERFAPPTADEKAALRAELGFDADARCALYVGRLSRLKGMDDLLDAIDSLAGVGRDDLEFHLVGTGPYQSRFADLDHTVVHGFVDPDRVNRYYRASDLYVHPSYVEEGGVCWTMLEAAATGLPVVARDVADAADLASFVFTDVAALEAYLRQPERWEPATYPDAWSFEAFRPAYDRFVTELAGAE